MGIIADMNPLRVRLVVDDVDGTDDLVVRLEDRAGFDGDRFRDVEAPAGGTPAQRHDEDEQPRPSACFEEFGF